MADFELKFEGSLGFEGNRGSHIDRTNRVWAFGFGHKIKNGWDSDKIEEINEIYQIMRNAYSLTRGLLVVIPRNGGGEIGINNFNLNLFETKGNLRPTSFSIHIYKTEGGQFPVHREIEFSGVSRPGKPQETVFQPFWVNGVPIGFGSNDPSLRFIILLTLSIKFISLNFRTEILINYSIAAGTNEGNISFIREF